VQRTLMKLKVKEIKSMN